MIIASTQPHTEGGRRMGAASNTERVAMARNGDLFFSFDPDAKHLETEHCPTPSLMMQDPRSTVGCPVGWTVFLTQAAYNL